MLTLVVAVVLLGLVVYGLIAGDNAFGVTDSVLAPG
jgi:hypothetical protein